jgi:hypothetical protein
MALRDLAPLPVVATPEDPVETMAGSVPPSARHAWGPVPDAPTDSAAIGPPAPDGMACAFASLGLGPDPTDAADEDISRQPVTSDVVPSDPESGLSGAKAGVAAPPRCDSVVLSAPADSRPPDATQPSAAPDMDAGVAPEVTAGPPEFTVPGKPPSDLPRGIPAYWAALLMEPDSTALPEPTTPEGAAPVRAAVQPPQTSARLVIPPQPGPVVHDAIDPGDRPLAHDDIVPFVQQRGTETADAVMEQASAGGSGAPALPKTLPAQIAAALAARVERPVDLQIVTDELGRLHLGLLLEGTQLHVSLQADRGETLDLLRRNADLLLEELRAAGFTGATLSFGDGRGKRDHPAPPPLDAPAAAAAPVAPMPQPTSASLGVAAGAGLDLRY